MPEFNRQLVEDWVKALRSGDYQQTGGTLVEHDNTFCCLGVLCAVKVGSTNMADIHKIAGCTGTIDEKAPLYTEAGLGTNVPANTREWPFKSYVPAHDYFYSLNDSKGKKFPEIADEIERILLNG